MWNTVYSNLRYRPTVWPLRGLRTKRHTVITRVLQQTKAAEPLTYIDEAHFVVVQLELRPFSMSFSKSGEVSVASNNHCQPINAQLQSR